MKKLSLAVLLLFVTAIVAVAGTITNFPVTTIDLGPTLATKAPINSPAFTGTVTGITKSMVGLGSVDNTSDVNKPLSTAAQAKFDSNSTVTQQKLNAKAPLASPTFTGTVGGITKAMVGLGSVDNVSDENKPISIQTAAALATKATTGQQGVFSSISTTAANGTRSINIGNTTAYTGAKTHGTIFSNATTLYFVEGVNAPKRLGTGGAAVTNNYYSGDGQDISVITTDSTITKGNLYIVNAAARILFSNHSSGRTTIFTNYSAKLVPDSGSKVYWRNPSNFTNNSSAIGSSVKIPAGTQLDLVSWGSPIFQAIMTTQNLVRTGLSETFDYGEINKANIEGVSGSLSFSGTKVIWSERTTTDGGSLTYAHWNTYSNSSTSFFQLYTVDGTTATLLCSTAAQNGTGAQPDSHDAALTGCTISAGTTYLVAVCVEDDGTGYNGAYVAQPAASYTTYAKTVDSCGDSFDTGATDRQTGSATRTIYAWGDSSATR